MCVDMGTCCHSVHDAGSVCGIGMKCGREGRRKGGREGG